MLRTVVLQALGERGMGWGIIAANALMVGVGLTWGIHALAVLSQKFASRQAG